MMSDIAGALYKIKQRDESERGCVSEWKV